MSSFCSSGAPLTPIISTTTPCCTFTNCQNIREPFRNWFSPRSSQMASQRRGRRSYHLAAVVSGDTCTVLPRQANSFESVQWLLSCPVALFFCFFYCPAKVSRKCGYVLLSQEQRLHSPPSIIYSQSFLFNLAPRVTANIVFLTNAVVLL